MQFNQIKSKDNIRIKRLVKLQSSARFRKEEGCFILEGLRTIDDAAINNVCLKELYFTNEAYNKHSFNIEKFAQLAGFTSIISDSVAKSISDTATTQGIFAVAEIPENKKAIDINGKYIALENLQDPSNLGAVARTAEALGISGIILSADSCDPFSPKSIRASMGTLLRIPLILTENMQEFIKNTSLKSFACVAHGQSEKLNTVSFENGSVCVIGNEANGLKEETILVCDKKVTIPMKGSAESLNAAVAAAIVMWEMIK